ncbi:stanniocalcin-2a [Narcine bancroftii]|uniref:stanniocalcin-2a n=1 Tax=Narcine bancroftii TaxID=1343680 RepID=UPI0038311284
MTTPAFCLHSSDRNARGYGPGLFNHPPLCFSLDFCSDPAWELKRRRAARLSHLHRAWLLPSESAAMDRIILEKVLTIILLIFARPDLVLGTGEFPENQHERGKLANQQKARLSLQDTAEIQHCLVNTGDVGCGVFQCFENNSCEINGPHDICLAFLHNAGRFDAQGKSFIKDTLKCMAHGLRAKFSCISRKCSTIQEMVSQLQQDCYLKHDLCSTAKENINVVVEMIHIQHLLSKGSYLEFIKALFHCHEDIMEAVKKSVRSRFSQNLVFLRQIFQVDSCSSIKQTDQVTPTTAVPDKKKGDNRKGNKGSADVNYLEYDRENARNPKGEKEKIGKIHPNAHVRARGASQVSRRTTEEHAHVGDSIELSDIRR